MEPDAIVTTDKPAEAPDLKAEMKEFLDKEAQAEKQDDGKENPQPGESDEEAEADEQEEDSEDSEEKDSEDKKDDKKKPNRYQKLKAKNEALQALAQKHSADTNKAVEIANVYRNRYIQAMERLKAIENQAARGEYKPDPREQENWSLKSKLQEDEYRKEIEKKQSEEQAKQEILQAKEQMKEEYRSSALKLAKRFGMAGDEGKQFARQVLKAYAFSVQAGEPDSMEEIASTLMSANKRRQQGNLEREQLTANRSAPSPIRTGSGRAPSYDIVGDYDKDRKAMKAYLESLKGK